MEDFYCGGVLKNKHVFSLISGAMTSYSLIVLWGERQFTATPLTPLVKTSTSLVKDTPSRR